MDFPNVSEVAEAIKGAFAAPSSEATTEAPAQEAQAEATPTEAGEATAPASAPSTEPAAASVTESASTTAAKFISEKGARAFIAELPEEVKEQLGPELNKAWYKRLNERDAQFRALEAKQAAEAEATRAYLDKRLEELVTSGMSAEDKKAYLDNKELERLRAKESKAKETPAELTEQEVQAMLAQHPVTAEFWKAVADAGLPRSVDDPRVAAIWQQAYHEPTPQAAVAKIRSLAAAHKPQPKESAPDIDKLVAERLEAALDKKLKSMGLLKSDTGKPGVGGSEKPSTSWEAARKSAEQAMRESQRG
jgi:hypothetical protein